MNPRPKYDSDAGRTLRALMQLGRDAAARPTHAELDRGLNALFARIAVRDNRRELWLRRSLLALAVVACLIGGERLGVSLRDRWHNAEAPALAYRVEGGSVLEGGYLRGSGNGEIKVLFNEGTQAVFMRGARGRLRTVDEQGSRVVLDHGTASFEVARSKSLHWFVEAGPFLVAVKGTRFTVTWDPVTEQFELDLRHGQVVVSGPVLEGNIELSAGRRLVVNLPRAETRISDERTGGSEPSRPEPPVRVDSTDVAPPTAASSTSSKGSSQGAPSSSAVKAARSTWGEQLARGQWDRILEDAERAGIETTLEKAPSEELFALADAARYRRRLDVARAALLAQRRRFPQSPRSLDAVFLLGRITEARDRPRALEWYDDYLSRAATGAYAAEALGRKMILTNELGGRAAARPIAEEYLRRFPGGSYAGSARALCTP